LHPSILFYILVESLAYNRNVVHASNTLHWSDWEDSAHSMHMQLCFCIQNLLLILKRWCSD